MRRDAPTTYRQRVKDKSIWIHRRCELMFTRLPPLQPRLQKGGGGSGGGGEASRVIWQSRHHNRQGRAICDEPCSPPSMVCWPYVPLGGLCVAAITAPCVLWGLWLLVALGEKERNMKAREQQKQEKASFLEEWRRRVSPPLRGVNWSHDPVCHVSYCVNVTSLSFTLLQ